METQQAIHPRVVHVNIGSNKGNSRLNISRAMKGIGEEFGQYEISHIITSPAWGFTSRHSFLNLGVQFITDVSAEEILEKLLNVQNSISSASHRTATGGYADREIDIDIVFIGEEEINTPSLKVPHRHLAERSFFLEPLDELSPGWRHPLTGKNASEMLAELNEPRR